MRRRASDAAELLEALSSLPPGVELGDVPCGACGSEAAYCGIVCVYYHPPPSQRRTAYVLCESCTALPDVFDRVERRIRSLPVVRVHRGACA